ncbi:MAG: ATP-dependent zinc metalloprotease FtsH [Clostridia bacterium]|nr:ATP-dependent zinc metalloprotease FtsH [Clostridia bacterium]
MGWWINSGPQGKQISDTKFSTMLNNEQIVAVEISNKKIQIKGKDGKYYWFYNRSDAHEENIRLEIREYNEDITAENNKPENKANPEYQPKPLIKTTLGSTTTINIMNILYPLFWVLALGGLIFITLRQLKGANSKGMEFTKNRARVSQSKVKFDKVAGADEEKQELEEIIQFLKDPDKFTRIGARIPKGVLLVGPPGTGKTLLARAVAGEANVPFFTISGSDFMELYVGVGASRVRDLFENAKKAKPCIVFIDEIDAVGRQRGTGLGGGNDEREQTLNQLLVQMDGFEQNEGIIVMAATNRVDILDPALTRPGRFDRQIYISAPDVKGREEILRVHAEGKPLAKNVKLKEIARVTSGFTGADLENLLNEAAILAARNNKEKISNEDINNAIVKVTMGPQKRSRVVTEKDKKITAYHESGHAVVEKCIKTSNPVHEVSIIQRGGAAGYTMTRPENDESFMTRQKLIDTISMMLGGRCAEKIFLDDITTGASSDISRATSLARKMVTEWGMSDTIGLINYGSENEYFLGRDYQSRASYSEKEAAVIDAEIKKIIDECHKQAMEILNSHKEHIEVMVKVLLEKETIYSDEVDMIMKGASAEEVINFIEDKAKAKTKEEKEEKKAEEKVAEAQLPKAGDYVDELIKNAEKRAEEKKKEEVELEKKEEQPKDKEKKKEESSQKNNKKTDDTDTQK